MANIGPDNFELVKELLGDKNTMNRSTLEEVLFEELGFSREMSRVFVTQFFQTISDVYFHPSKKLTDFIDYNLRQKA